MDDAFALAEAALRRGVKHPLLFRVFALKCEREKRYDAAIGAYEVALAAGIGEGDLETLNAIGLCHARAGQLEASLAAFDRALQIQANSSWTYYYRGWALEHHGELLAAASAYERAIQIEPAFAPAIANAAMMAARLGRTEHAVTLADRALEIEPLEPTARLALSMIDVEAGKAVEAEHRLRGLLAEPDLPAKARLVAELFMGDALDKQRRPAEAFAAWQTANRLAKAEHSGRVKPGRELVQMLDEHFSTRRSPWPRSSGTGPEPVRGHVFIVGFPRSGTTLLGQVLAAHPEIDVLDEYETLTQSYRELMGSFSALDRLAQLDEAGLAVHRERYWQTVRKLGAAPSTERFFVDKLPMNTLARPLIARLFPEARIVVVRRDPRDAVLGCFRRQFTMSPMAFEFLDLADTAAYYDAVMRLSDLYDSRLSEHRIESRHEDLLADFDGETQRICAFLGLPWNPAMRTFGERAKASGSARSVSSEQVTRGLYRSGTGQWRAYAEQLAPMLPRLSPWVRRFGYPEDLEANDSRVT